MNLRRIVGEGDLQVIEGTIDYGDGTPVSYVGIAEFEGGKLNKITEYFASPFEAPAWRADFVERMEPAGVRCPMADGSGTKDDAGRLETPPGTSE
jgi:hypothetical protein